MENKKTYLKITLLYLYIYFGGPLIWGIWMTKRLKIITIKEYLDCLFSKYGIGICLIFFLVNYIYTLYRMKKKSETERGACSIQKMHCISLLVFGFIGTPIFLSSLSFSLKQQVFCVQEIWMLKIMIGAVAGISLIFMFYILFSVIIMEELTAFFKIKHTKVIMEKIDVFNKIVYFEGLLCFVISATMSYVLWKQKQNIKLNTESVLAYALSMMIPVGMSFLLYTKAKKRIRMNVNLEKEL